MENVSFNVSYSNGITPFREDLCEYGAYGNTYSSIDSFTEGFTRIAGKSNSLSLRISFNSPVSTQILESLLDGIKKIFSKFKAFRSSSSRFARFSKLAISLQSLNFTVAGVIITSKHFELVMTSPRHTNAVVSLADSKVTLKCPSKFYQELVSDVAISLKSNHFITVSANASYSTVIWPNAYSLESKQDVVIAVEPSYADSQIDVKWYDVYYDGVKVKSKLFTDEIVEFLNSLSTQDYCLTTISFLPDEFRQFFELDEFNYRKRVADVKLLINT